MPKITNKALILALCLAMPAFFPPLTHAAPIQDAPAGASKPVSFLGTVQTIDGKTLTVKNDAGVTMQVAVQDNARLLRIEPGQKNLQGAQPLNLPDLQIGDRVLARGAPSADGKQIAALMLVAIKKTDIAQMQQQDLEDWQKHGVGGLVKSVDPAAGTVTISLPGKQTLTIQDSKNTILRRYAPGSVKFDDAKPAPLDEIKPGDQLRARGTKSTDGQSFAAEEIVSGTFLNIAGTIVSINPADSSFTVTDLATKHPVVVHVAADTQIKKLDPMVAQRIAMRLKGGARAAGQGGGNRPATGSSTGSGDTGSAESTDRPAPDPQQILARAPSVTLNNFAKGDAVMLVATEGTPPGSITAVTVIGGVEPMLQASTSRSQAMLSSAWNVGGGGGGDEGGGGQPQ